MWNCLQKQHYLGLFLVSLTCIFANGCVIDSESDYDYFGGYCLNTTQSRAYRASPCYGGDTSISEELYARYITEVLTARPGGPVTNSSQPTALQFKSGAKAASPLSKSLSPRGSGIDKTPPVIEIDKELTVDTDSPAIVGRVSDASEIAQVTVNGVMADLKDGVFSFSRYVPIGGTDVRIEATDEWGNRSQKTVSISRSEIETVPATFDPLDPTGFSSETNKDAIALIIGVADYKRVAEARYADRDAEFFSGYAKRKLGVPDGNIKVLTNATADFVDIIEAANVWLPRATKADRSDVYLFFAGHGLGSDDGNELYLLPHSGIPKLLDRTSILRSDLFKSIADAKPRSVTVFLDTCYSGTSRTEETLLASRPVLLAPKRQDVPNNFTLISAASINQTAKLLPEVEHGLFSYWLMKGMEGPADENGDQQITAGEIYRFTLANVSRIERDQTPEFQGDAERVLFRWQ
jgi:hypothetical protein